MLCSQRAEGVDDVIIIICILYDLVYWEISYIWSEGILGDYEIALYSSILSGDSYRTGCWWTAVYCFSIAVDSRNHSTGSITFIVFGNYSEGSIPRGILNRNCEGTEKLQHSKNQT